MNRSFRITLGIPTPEKEPTSVNEMRLAVDRASWDSALIKRSQDTARMAGLSGEDTYVMLAYYALRELERLYQANMDMLMTRTVRTIIADPKL